MAKHIANILTGGRILGGILLLFFPAFSVGFYITYLFCGVSDMVDGTIARKTNSASEFGSKLDTIADLIFVAVAMIKLLPAIHLPCWLWVWGGVIAVIKIVNKITGLLLFLFPLTISFVDLTYTATVVCAIATFSAVQEGLLVKIGQK